MKIKPNTRTWVEIDTKALVHNMTVIQGLLPKGTKLMAVVKSNAYGHGIVGISQILEKKFASKFAVDSFEEAIILRKAGIKAPVLVLGFTLDSHFQEASRRDIELTISSIDSLKDLLRFKSKKPLLVSLKVDTGLHRQGFLESDRREVLSLLNKLPMAVSPARELTSGTGPNVHTGGNTYGAFSNGVKINGLYSHCAVLDERGGRGFTNKQIKRFEEWATFFDTAGYKLEKHLFSSSGVFLKLKKKYDYVRAGIALYGIYPSDWISKKHKIKKLIPALSWKTIISEIKNIKNGDALGYGLTEKVSRDTKIGICPVGYWHGYPRALSKKGIVLVNGKKAKVLGTISMDMMVVNLNNIRGAKPGTIVTLIGKDGKGSISAEEVAQLAGTINYETLTRINPEIPRI